MRYVLDASAGLYLASSARGFGGVSGHEFHAPGLFWSEGVSSIHQRLWRAEISRQLADRALKAILDAPVERHSDSELYGRAWQIAEQAGWAKTYDAEYVALSQLLDIPLVTRDDRLRRGAGRLARVIPPSEIGASQP